MAKVYLPSDLVNKDCKVVYNDYIRVYTNTQHTTYTDVYFKSDYLLKSGSTSQTPINLVCDSLNTYTDDFFYRYDMPNTLLMFFILLIICIYFPYRVISRILGKWGKF